MVNNFCRIKENKEASIYKWEFSLDDGKKIQGRTINDLKSKVIILGHEWDENCQLVEKHEKNKNKINQLKNKSPDNSLKFQESKISTKPNKRISRNARIISVPKEDITPNTGLKHVKFDKLNKKWIYDNKHKIYQDYLWKLEEDIINQDLEWEVTNQDICDNFKREEHEKILSFSLPRFYKFLKEHDVLKNDSNKLDSIIEDYERKNNSTGIVFVSNISNNTGNNWRYKNFKDNSWIYASTLAELEKTIKTNDLPWKIINNQLYDESLYKDMKFTEKLNNEIIKQKKDTKTGLFRVSFNDNWEYNYSNSSGEKFKINKRTISQLKDEILKLNLPWIDINPELTEKTIMKEKQLIEKYNAEMEIKRIIEEKEKIKRNKKLKEIGSEKPNIKRKELNKFFR